MHPIDQQASRVRPSIFLPLARLDEVSERPAGAVIDKERGPILPSRLGWIDRLERLLEKFDELVVGFGQEDAGCRDGHAAGPNDDLEVVEALRMPALQTFVEV